MISFFNLNFCYYIFIVFFDTYIQSLHWVTAKYNTEGVNSSSEIFFICQSKRDGWLQVCLEHYFIIWRRIDLKLGIHIHCHWWVIALCNFWSYLTWISTVAYCCGHCKMQELQISKVVDPEFYTDHDNMD